MNELTIGFDKLDKHWQEMAQTDCGFIVLNEFETKNFLMENSLSFTEARVIISQVKENAIIYYNN